MKSSQKNPDNPTSNGGSADLEVLLVYVQATILLIVFKFILTLFFFVFFYKTHAKSTSNIHFVEFFFFLYILPKKRY